MTKTCPDCQATVLSTSQPERTKPAHSEDLLDTLMEVYEDAVNNGDGYLGRAQLEYTLMKHDLCLVDARDRDPAALAAAPAVGGEIMRDKLAELQNAGVKSLTINQIVGLLGFAETEAAAPPASPLRIDLREALEGLLAWTGATRAGITDPEERAAFEDDLIIATKAFAGTPDQRLIASASPLRLSDQAIEVAAMLRTAVTAQWQPMSMAPKDAEIVGQDSEGRVFNLRWDPDDCGENWYDVHGDQMAYPVRWMPLPTVPKKA